MINIHLLKNLQQVGSKLVAQCPACAEHGNDQGGNHLCVFEDGNGAYHCIVDEEGAGSAHSQRIFELVGLHGKAVVQRPLVVKRIKPPCAKPPPNLPMLYTLRVREKIDIGVARGWKNMSGVYELCARELLLGADVFDNGKSWPSWVITDSSRRNAQARRLDGQDWSGIGAKAKTLPGCLANWPIGAADILDRLLVLLCEGQPDFCSALTVATFEGLPIDEVAPVCMAGAGQSIHSDALHFFEGKRVRIFQHPDEAGARGAYRWAEQLATVGATVDGFQFEGIRMADGRPVKDLADFTTLIRSGAKLPRVLDGLL